LVVSYTRSVHLALPSPQFNIDVYCTGDMETFRQWYTAYIPQKETHLVGVIQADMVLVSLGEPLNGSPDHLNSTLLPHLFRAEVAVASSPIPVS